MKQSQQQRLILRRDFDTPDELEQRWKELSSRLAAVISGKGEREAIAAISERVSTAGGPDAPAEVASGLLFSVLTSGGSKTPHWQLLTTAVPDWAALTSSLMRNVVGERFAKLEDSARQQACLVVGELVRVAAPEADSLVAMLMRNTGSTADQRNVSLVESVLGILGANKAWLYQRAGPPLVSLACYTFLRLVSDFHGRPALARQKQLCVSFCDTVLRERFMDCASIGRDLIRLLQDVSKIPEFDRLWSAILRNPSSLDPAFKGFLQIATAPTAPHFSQSRITFEIERDLVFLMTKPKPVNINRYMDFFQRRFVVPGENDSLWIDIVRYVCCNRMTQSPDAVQRWMVLGWIVFNCNSIDWIASNIKLALFFDWLWFDPKTESLNSIEPVAIMMFSFVQSKTPQISASLVEFLVHTIGVYFKAEQARIRANVVNAMTALLERGIVLTFEPLFNFDGFRPQLKEKIRDLFPLQHRGAIQQQQQQQQEQERPQQEQAAPADQSMDACIATFSTQPTPVVLRNVIAVFISNSAQENEEKLFPVLINSLRPETIDTSPASAFYGYGLLQTIFHFLVVAQDERTKKVVWRILQKAASSYKSVGYRFAAFQIITSAGGLALNPNPGDAFDRSPNTSPSRGTQKSPRSSTSSVGLESMLWGILEKSRASNTTPQLLSKYGEFLKFLRSTGSTTEATAFIADCKACADQSPKTFSLLAPFFYSCLPELAVGAPELFCLVVRTHTPAQVHELTCRLTSRELTLLGTAAAGIVPGILELPAFEQSWAWRLVCAELRGNSSQIEELVSKTLIPTASEGTPELLSGILALLQDVPPSRFLISRVLTLPRQCSSTVSAILSCWSLVPRFSEHLAAAVPDTASAEALANHVAFWLNCYRPAKQHVFEDRRVATAISQALSARGMLESFPMFSDSPLVLATKRNLSELAPTTAPTSQPLAKLKKLS